MKFSQSKFYCTRRKFKPPRIYSKCKNITSFRKPAANTNCIHQTHTQCIQIYGISTCKFRAANTRYTNLWNLCGKSILVEQQAQVKDNNLYREHLCLQKTLFERQALQSLFMAITSGALASCVAIAAAHFLPKRLIPHKFH